MLIGGRIVSELINAPANRELRQLLVLLGRIYVRHIKMELAAEACNFNIHTSSRPSNYGLFMALSLSRLSRAGLQCSRMCVCGAARSFKYWNEILSRITYIFSRSLIYFKDFLFENKIKNCPSYRVSP